MLKTVAIAGACVLALSACTATSKLSEISYRTHHLMFEKWEYEKSPGVLLRASAGAWGRYDEVEKLPAIPSRRSALAGNFPPAKKDMEMSRSPGLRESS